MNKYLEKIARSRHLSYAKRKIREHDLVETAMDLKGRYDDIGSLKGKYKQEDKKRKKR